MPRTPDELAKDLAELADEVAALDDTPPVDPPTKPAPPAKPTGLACVIADGRPQLSWDSAPAVTAWEVLDLANTAKPLQATVNEPHTTRAPLKPGQHRRYAIIAIGPGGRSEMSDSIDVPPADDPDKPPTGRYPSDVLPTLKTWTVTTTTGKQGSPFNNYLIGQDIPDVFYVRPDGGVMFHATVDGFHTPNSHRCRVEGRQMADGNWTKAAWNGADPHVMEADMWISTAGLEKRKRVCGLQIHDGADDVLQVSADAAQGLIVVTDDGKTVNVLDPGYRDEQRFTCRIETGGGKVRVVYNGGAKTVEVPANGTGWYFKAGAYNQASMEEHGEPASAFGEVVIYSLTATGKLVG